MYSFNQRATSLPRKYNHIIINNLQIVFYYFCLKSDMKNLIVIGHPDQQSFCYNGIFSTIKSEIEASGQELEIIDFIVIALRVHEPL